MAINYYLKALFILLPNGFPISWKRQSESGMLSTEDQKHPWMMQRLSDDKRPNN